MTRMHAHRRPSTAYRIAEAVVGIASVLVIGFVLLTRGAPV